MSKYAGPRNQNGPRKRTGCVTCKNAHVKCTEEKPRCHRCERLKLCCKYEFTLLWEEDAAQRGVVHGRKGVWSKDGKKHASQRKQDEGSKKQVWAADIFPASNTSIESWDFVNFEARDFVNGIPQDLLSDEREQERLVPSIWTLEVTKALPDQFVPLPKNNTSKHPTPHDMEEADEEFGSSPDNNSVSQHWADESFPKAIPVFSFTSIETQLMDYYIRSLAPKCSLSIDLNPYLDILLPVAYDFAPLRHTLLAASACQLFHFSGEKVYEVQSLRHRSKAIRGLNEYLGREKMDWKSLATMAMFCFRDITDGCEPSWITHLQMGLRMLRELRCGTRTDVNLQNFCEIYFVTHEVMGRTAWDDENGEVDVYGWEIDEGYQEIDAIMGCSRELISLISQISSLAADLQRQSSDHTAHATKAISLLNQLFSLEQIPRQGSLNAGSMVQIAEIKRLSAILYFHDRVLEHLFIPSLASSPVLSVANLQESIITSLQKLPASSGASLWPLFVLGKSSLLEPDHIRFVLDRLVQLEKSRYLGSVYHARRRVERDIRTRLLIVDPRDSGSGASSGNGMVCENERWVSLA